MPDARPDTEYVYRARLLNVVDGDTVDLEIDLGFRITREVRVRLKGVDTAETYGVRKESEEYAAGMEQKQLTEAWLRRGMSEGDGEYPLRVRTWKDATGKFGRYLADLYRQTEAGEIVWDASLTDTLKTKYPEVATDE